MQSVYFTFQADGARVCVCVCLCVLIYETELYCKLLMSLAESYLSATRTLLVGVSDEKNYDLFASLGIFDNFPYLISGWKDKKKKKKIIERQRKAVSVFLFRSCQRFCSFSNNPSFMTVAFWHRHNPSFTNSQTEINSNTATAYVIFILLYIYIYTLYI